MLQLHNALCVDAMVDRTRMKNVIVTHADKTVSHQTEEMYST